MIPFSPPRMDQDIIDEVTSVLKSGWITTGPKTKQFEQELTKYCGNRSTACVGSATAGLELVLRWFGVGEGDEVILPTYTYCATANVVVHCGAKPVFVDVGTDFNITVQNIREAITEKTKVIMPVDIGGVPCDYDQINELVRGQDVASMFNASTENQEKLGRMLVLADAAHSIGAKYKSKRSGSLTDMTVFSFHAVKNLVTAEGGAICINLPSQFDVDELYKSFCISSLHGQNKDALAKTKVGSWEYDIIDAGYKCNMTDIQAAIGLVELKRYDSDMLVRRKSIFDQYVELFSSYSWAQIPDARPEDKESSYHLFMLRIKGVSEKQRNLIIDEIFRLEVSVNVHFKPLPMMSFYKSRGYDIADYPVSYDNYSREISLPIYYNLSDKDVLKVAEAVVQSVELILN
ncbi:MAG: DegT/DnrJ/EryC1/StrS family aminotransferase [Flavobacteriales bacterium]|nr:DegT/DnrJ/EryC1/StrS family aminotransferase [Flavobacteriales bacterium]